MEPVPLSARRTLSLSKQAATAGAASSATSSSSLLSSKSSRRVPSIRLQVGEQTIELSDVAANGLPSSFSSPGQPDGLAAPPGIVFSGNGDDDGARPMKDSSRILGKKSYLAPIGETTTSVDIIGRSPAPSAAPSAAPSSAATPLPAPPVLKPKKSRWVCVSEVLLWLTFIAITAIGGVLVYNFVEKEEDRMTMILSVAGTFACITSALSLHDIHLHVRFYVSSLQRLYIRILAMCIVYSLTSWLALRYLHNRVYFEIVREWYESLLLYSFFQLMLSFLGGKKKLAQRLKETGKGVAKHPPGCCCLRPWRLGSRFVHRTSIGVMQYVLLRFVVSAIALICEATGVYQEGNWSPKYFYAWAAVLINCSQMWALYCLGLFYMQTKQWLRILRPLVKFGLIKVIVFVFFWQSFAISIASSIGLLKPMWGLNLHDTMAILQNTIIEAELVLCAVAHHYFFGYQDFYSQDSSVVTPIMRLQMEEAAFDARQAAEAEKKAAEKAGLDGRTRTSTDMSLAFSDPLADPSVANASVLKTPRIKSARSSTATTAESGGGAPGSQASASSFYKPSRTASLSVPITATAGANASNFNLADAAQQTPRRVSAAAALVSTQLGSAASARSGASGSSALEGSPDAGPVVVVSSPGDLDLFPDSSSTGASASNPNTAAGASFSSSKRSSLENPFDAPSLPGVNEGDEADDGNDDADAGGGLPLSAPAPLPVSQALYEMLPIDVVQETAAQIKSGFGLLHKIEKRKAEEERKMEIIRNSERAKKSKFAQGTTAASASSGLRAPGDSTATNSVAGSTAGSVESSRRNSTVGPFPATGDDAAPTAVSTPTAKIAPEAASHSETAAPPPEPAAAAPPSPPAFMDWEAAKAKVASRTKSRREERSKQRGEEEEREEEGAAPSGRASRATAMEPAGAAVSNPFDEF